MKRLRLLVIAFALLAVAALALLVGPLRDRWQEPLRRLIAREIGAAFGTTCAIDTLSIALVPPRVEVGGVRLGDDGAIASLGAAHAELDLRRSLRQGRVVLDVAAGPLALDLPAFLHALPPPHPGPPEPLPSFRVRRLRVHDARVQLTEAASPITVDAPLLDGELGADAIQGRLSFAGRGGPLTLEHGPHRTVLTSVAAAGGETDIGWQLQRVAVRGEGLTLDGHEREGALRLAGDVDLSSLALLDESLAALAGAAHLEGSLEGALEEPTLTATVQLPALRVADHDVGAVDVTARLDRRQLAVSSLKVRGYGGSAAGSATLQLDERLQTSARLTWRGLALREVAGAIGSELPAAVLEGVAEVGGTLTPLRLGGTASGRISAPGAPTPVDWKGSGRYADGGGSGTVEISQPMGNNARAEVAVSAAGALDGTVRIRVANPDALAAIAAIGSLPQVRGALDATARLGGTLSDPRYEGSIDGRGLSLLGVQVDSIRGDFAGDRRMARSDGIRAALGGGTLAANGTLALDRAGANTWAVHATGIDAGTLTAAVGGLTGVRPPIAGGRLTLDAAATGPWPSVRLTAAARLGDFWLGRERIAELSATAEAAAGAWNAEARMRNRGQQEVVLRASGRGSDDLAIALDCEAWTLTSLWRGEEVDMGGTLRARAALRGPARALSGTATLTADDLVLGGRAFRAVRVDVTADRGRWHAATALLDDALRVTADVRPDPGFPFAADVSWSEADFARLLGAQPNWQMLSSGSVHASGRLDAIAQLEARLELTQLTLTGGAQPVAAEVPLSITCRAGRCRVADVTVRSGDTTLRLDGEAGFDGRVRLALAGGGTLGMLELIGKPIESARGTFTVDATITHGGGGWSALGTLELAQVGLDAGLPVAITRTSGRLVFDGEHVRIEQLGGRIGSGTFTIGGSIDLRAGPSVTWALHDVGADPLPALEVEVGGQGTLEGSWEHLRVAGDLRIVRLLYDRNIELADFLPQFNRALAAAPREQTGREIQLALTVQAPGDLYVENNLTRLEGRMHLSLTGTTARPVLDGRVEALDGEVYLRGRTFELLGATVDFRPDLGLAAALNISAESLIDTPDGSYVVTVRVTGTTVDPRVTLTSDDPSLSQTDIATLIAFGRTMAQMRQNGGGAFSLSGAIGNPIGTLLGGQAEKVLPIDRIEFEPTFSATTGAFEPQLTLGKDLTEDLAASIGQTFGVASRTRVEINYRLAPRIWALGSWESQTETEAGAFAAGLRARYEFWRLTPYTLLGGLQ
ncbi:translocation/assembly module TamB domain-containing protein [bacterium]|nr:translocation/assembly module TamB domain-containing protein [bacterium]